MAPPVYPSRYSPPGLFSRLWGSLRRTLARLLLPDEVPGPNDLAAIVVNPQGDGLWTLNRRGNIFAFGKVPEFREIPQPDPWREGSFVALACTPSGQGLWALDSKGNILSFGDAPEFREIPQPDPWREGSFVALACTLSGQGLWVLERGGRILSFGDVPQLRPSWQK